jgi:hypothetical protein
VRFHRALVTAALAGLVATAPGIAAETSTKPAPQKPPTSSPTAKKPTQTQTAPAPNEPVQTDQGITVRENYYLDLPGFDLTTLTPKQKKKFLDRVNSEYCTCGCPNDTIARCLVNDPKCSVVRGLAEKVFSEVKAGK